MPSRRNLEYNKTPNNYEALGKKDGQTDKTAGITDWNSRI